MSGARTLPLLTALLATDPRDSAAAALSLREFLQEFARAPELERAKLRSLLSDPEARQVASSSVVAAEQALATRDPSWLTWSLWAHDVEQFRQDPRDNIRALSVTDYAAQQLGIDGPELFRSVAQQVSPSSAAQLRAFAARSPDLRALSVMGVRPVEIDGRVRFEFE
ncbi:MAG TPA: hypothetical protein VJV78_26845 [Polyangiales bacterium]|nr:hypothetical protein [Polyangiales bacterium]